MKLIVGSHLYGTAHESSDRDYLNLVVPTKAQLVSNKPIKFAQEKDGETDNRTMLWGDFLMSLGDNVENTFVALSYPYFDQYRGEYLSMAFLHKALDTAQSMLTWNLGNPTVSAHAIRICGAIVQVLGEQRPYPFLSETYKDFYLRVKSGRFVFQTVPKDALDDLRADINDTELFPESTPERRDRMADIVFEIYKGSLS